MNPLYGTSEVALRGTIIEIVKVYTEQTERVRAAYAALEDAAHVLTVTIGKETTYSGIDTLPSRSSGYDYVVKEVLTNIKYQTWARLIDRLGIKKLLSVKRNKELHQKLSDKEHLPEITVESIYSMFEVLMENANDFVKEAILEVYEYLHVSPDYGTGGQYKTNQRNAFEDIGKKVIICGAVEPWYGSWHVRQWTDDRLRALDKVFHALDGKPFLDQGYNCPLLDAVRSCKGGGETEYFSFKCYQNGNLHLEFKRGDLLKEFNKQANDGTRLKSGKVF